MSVFKKISEKLETLNNFEDEMPIITLKDDNSIMIENYNAIRLFTDTEVELEFDDFVVNIKGNSLVINGFDPGIMKMTGKVTSLEYIRS